MNKDFIDSINSAENSNEEFFYINFGPKKIKIFFEEEACDWVWNYKYLRQQEAIDIKTELIHTQIKINCPYNYFILYNS